MSQTHNHKLGEAGMSPYQILEAFCQRFPDTTEAHIREFGEVVKISYKVVDEFLGCKETHTEARI